MTIARDGGTDASNVSAAVSVPEVCRSIRLCESFGRPEFYARHGIGPVAGRTHA